MHSIIDYRMVLASGEMVYCCTDKNQRARLFAMAISNHADCLNVGKIILFGISRSGQCATGLFVQQPC
jgi:hypothetical protein